MPPGRQVGGPSRRTFNYEHIYSAMPSSASTAARTSEPDPSACPALASRAHSSTTASAPGASRSSAMRSRMAERTRSPASPPVASPVTARRCVHRGPPGRQPVRRRGQGTGGPVPVRPVVMRDDRQPDRHRVVASSEQFRHEDQVAARFRHLLAIKPHHSGVRVPAGEGRRQYGRRSPRSRIRRCRRPARRARALRSSHGAGRSGPGRQPGRRKSGPGNESRSPRTRHASPACQGRTPTARTARPGRSASHTSGSTGSFLPGRAGSPPFSPASLIIVSVSRPDTEPNCRSAAREKYTSRRVRTANPGSPAVRLNSSISGIDSTAPT